jgi:hypothetical protein
MDAAHTGSRQPLAQLLQAIDDKAADLAAQLHPSWVDAISQRLGVTCSCEGARPARRTARLLTAAYELQWPSIGELRHPVHRIALLGRRDTLRVLTVCELACRRDSVRMAIGRETRDLLIEQIGAPAYTLLCEGPPQGVAQVQPVSPQDFDLELLAGSGYRLLCRSGAWRSRAALAITRMCLAPVAVEVGTRLPDDIIDAADDGGAAHHLHDYFPELAWLFGSDMDRALSE